MAWWSAGVLGGRSDRSTQYFKDTWENLVWSSKEVNARKGNRLPHEAGLKLLTVPRAPKEMPASALICNAHGVVEWKLFLNE